MAAIEEKNKIKIIPLISDADRKMNAQRSDAPAAPHIPTKDEIKKKALADMLKRVASR